MSLKIKEVSKIYGKNIILDNVWILGKSALQRRTKREYSRKLGNRLWANWCLSKDRKTKAIIAGYIYLKNKLVTFI